MLALRYELKRKNFKKIKTIILKKLYYFNLSGLNECKKSRIYYFYFKAGEEKDWVNLFITTKIYLFLALSLLSN